MRHRTFVFLIMMFAVPVAFAQMGKSSKKSDMASCEAMMQQHQSMQRADGGDEREAPVIVLTAVIPVAVATAPAPFSSAATASSSALTVGFPRRV